MSSRTMTKEGNREIYKFENQYTDETMTYDPDTEVMVIDIQFKPYARQNGVG